MDLTVSAQVLGNIGEFVGALAVVATLGFLALQIRQSNATSQAVATHSFVETISKSAAQLDDEALFQILKQGMYSLEDLGAFEHQRFYNWFVTFINHVHMGYRLHSKGILDRRTYRNWELSLLTMLQLPGYRSIWELRQHPPDFMQHIDNQLADPKALPLPVDVLYPWWKK